MCFKKLIDHPWCSSAVIAALVSALVAGVINWRISHNELSAKYIEISVAILSSRSGSDDKALREWAIDVINNYADSSLKITGDMRVKLINGEINLSGFGSTVVSASGTLD